MYFSNSNANKALEILNAAGFGAEKMQASRPVTGPRFILVVDAPHLPRLDGKVRTVTLRTPNELNGWGATAGEVERMNSAEATGLG